MAELGRGTEDGSKATSSCTDTDAVPREERAKQDQIPDGGAGGGGAMSLHMNTIGSFRTSQKK